MTFILKVLKLIFGICSGALSILLLLYLGIKNENWEILTSDGQVIINKTTGICLTVVWAVIGAMFLLFEFLYKRSKKGTDNNKQADNTDLR